MQKQGVYHTDIKPSNIFYTNGVVGYGDFGLSSRDPVAGSMYKHPHGYTVGYKPPEHYLNPTYDCYCLGITMLEYITQETWGGIPLDKNSLLSMDIDDIQGFVDQHSDIIDEIMGFLEIDEETRMSIEESAYSNSNLGNSSSSNLGNLGNLGNSSNSSNFLSVRSVYIEPSLIQTVGDMVDDTKELIMVYDCLNRCVEMELFYDLDDVIEAIVSLVKNFEKQVHISGNGYIQLYVLEILGGSVAGVWQDPMLIAFRAIELQKAVRILTQASQNKINIYKNPTKKMAKITKLDTDSSIFARAVKWLFQ
jgi:serine/threonine protein kinase